MKLKMTAAALMIVATISMGSLAKADGITDAQIQNFQNLAQVAYDKADVADAKGDRLAAARWRAQAHDFERQAQAMQALSDNLQNLRDAVTGGTD